MNSDETRRDIARAIHRRIEQNCESLRALGYPHVFDAGRWDSVYAVGLDAFHQWCYDNLTDFQIHADMRAIIAIRDADEALAFKMRWR